MLRSLTLVPGPLRASRSRAGVGVLAVLSLVAAFVVFAAPSSSMAADPCGDGSNPIVCENSKPGTPRSEWDIGTNAGSDKLQGFPTSISVQPGGTIDFKIDSTDLTSYTIEIYRTGWYGGDGARLIASVDPSVSLPQSQPECYTDDATYETDCGNWAVSASWDVPTTAVSGVYVADLWDPDTGDASQITFVVTDPSSHSDILVKTSDATWEAYNTYGGADFYQGAGPGRAYAISYNRPIVTRGAVYSGTGGRDFYFNAEYPLVEFLEENGYDVSYTTDVDTSLAPASMLEQHKVFVSSGHDEYWTGEERANVEAARDAGVNLQFLSGNEVYWHTRLTDSIAGTDTPDRTITSYKETWSNAKIDPSETWTGTWRDPRFASTSDGAGLPEEALTGTMYMNNATDSPVTVTAEQGAGALWANTGLSSMSGESTELADHTVGYESDEDVDNGSRQSGLIYLSTTTATTDQELTDFGTIVAPGTTTNHMTLYRASSGALVFSAGSIQWNWGLNSNHDGDGDAADPRMQQFEVNMLAFMGVQPQTLMSGLVAGAGLVDTTPPTAVVTSPAPGSSIPDGTAVTLTGTASDVGGIVAAVEVSVDGGETWHMATGTDSWSYQYVQHGMGQESVQVRAVDDSANYAATPVTASYDVTGPTYSVLGDATPKTVDTGDPDGVELGMKFTAAEDGVIQGIRFYKSDANTGTHVGHLWDANGNLLASVTFSDESVSGWQTAALNPPVSVTAGTSYVVSYTAPNGHYSADSEAWAYRGNDAGPLTVAGGYGTSTGVYAAPGGFPTESYQATNYFVDAVFGTADTAPLTASSQWPLPGSSSVPTSTTITATLSRAIDPSSLSFTVTDQNGDAVAGATDYDAATRVATFTPTDPLAGFVTYSVALSATSATGAVQLGEGSTWSFRTVKPDPQTGVCPCSLYSDSTVPVELQDADAQAVTLGVRFTPSTDGTVTGVSFYKAPGNTGTHVGALWSASGEQLVTGTFDSESTSGWQTLTFSSPIHVTAGTSYVASYRTTVGAYSVTPDGFSGGLTVGPLTADSGMYSYDDGFPSATSTASYLVDVQFMKDAPTLAVTTQTPAPGETDVPSSSTISLGASAALDPDFTVSVMNGTTPVTGTTALSSDGMTATFTPDEPLPAATELSVTFGDLTGAAGGTLPDQSWTFTTIDPATPQPVTLLGDSEPAVQAETSDPAPVEVGMQFTASVPGQATGVRFYKGASNTGTHVGHLWSADGTELASVTFTDETASGWQSAQFSSPVTLTPGEVYVISYFAPNGNYSYTSADFASAKTSGPLTAGTGNGLYLYGTDGGMPQYSWNNTNYFVDVTFVPSGDAADPTPTPTPTDDSPPDGAETLFADSATPVNTSWPDSAPVQVGTKFTPAVAGTVTGIRYYRSTADQAEDTLYLWDASGNQLATATVPADTSPGWHYVAFDEPVELLAGGQYRASYYSTSRSYAVDPGGFAAAITRGDLTGLSGVVVYGTGTPDYDSTHNFWVDVSFVPSD